MTAVNISIQTEAQVDPLELALQTLKFTNGFYFHEFKDNLEEGVFTRLTKYFFHSSNKLQEAEEPLEEEDGENDLNNKSISTQTELEPDYAKTVQLSYLLLQDLGLDEDIPSDLEDEPTYKSLSHAVNLMLIKHSVRLNGMVNRMKLMDYRLFPSLADELFELNADNPTGELRINWGRIIALYAFAVRLSQENKNNPERVDLITKLLANYMTEHVLNFIKTNGGWKGLIDIFPPPEDSRIVLKSVLFLWSGVCVVAALFYLRSVFRRQR